MPVNWLNHHDHILHQFLSVSRENVSFRAYARPLTLLKNLVYAFLWWLITKLSYGIVNIFAV